MRGQVCLHSMLVDVSDEPLIDDLGYVVAFVVHPDACGETEKSGQSLLEDQSHSDKPAN
jgi:hypothetical protein